MEKQNLLLFRDNYGQQLFLFNVTFLSRLNIIRDCFSNSITNHKKTTLINTLMQITQFMLFLLSELI